MRGERLVAARPLHLHLDVLKIERAAVSSEEILSLCEAAAGRRGRGGSWGEDTVQPHSSSRPSRTAQ